MAGWIKVHRKIIGWEWYQDSNTFRVYFHCLLMANHEDKNWQGITIKRGEFITSSENLASDLGLTRQQIRTSLNKLKSTNNLTIKSTNKYTIINIDRYSDYQNEEIEINQQINQQINKRATSNQPAINQQSTTNKNVKNEKNEKKENKEGENLPKFLDPDSWNEWRKFRNEIKKPLTPTMEKKQIKFLEGLHQKGINYKETIEQSIRNGWQGLFEPKQTGAGKPSKATNNILKNAEYDEYWKEVERKEAEENAKKGENENV